MLNQKIIDGIYQGIRNRNIDIQYILSNAPQTLSRDVTVSHYKWELKQLETRIPDLGKVSLFLLIYGFLESELDKVCRFLHATKFSHEARKVINRINRRDFKDRGLTRSINYLKKVANIQIPKVFESKEFLILNKMRNHFVHSFGSVSKKEKQSLEHERNALINSSNILIQQFDFECLSDDEYAITLTNHFIDFFLDEIDSGFKEIVKHVDDLIESEG